MMREIIEANQRRSVLLITLLLGMLVVMGVGVGELVAPGGGGVVGLLGAFLIFGVQWGIYNFSPGSVVMQGMGGRQIEKAECPRLFNIVEEMQLASGLEKAPDIWLVDSPVPNAFAYSDGRGNASVAATTGLLYRLNRDELQGVMAHEVAHIVNRDVRFITLAGVVLGSIVVLSEVGWQMMRFGGRGAVRTRSSGNGGNAAQVAWLVVVLLLVILGPFMAQLLYFAISRKREYLADASAAVYTRYPEGLASALEKIQAHAAGLPGNKVAHAMCIVPPLAASGGQEAWSSTHPPTSKRIAILRSMGNSAGLAAYEESARRILGGGGSGLPQSVLETARRLEARRGSGEGPILERPAARTQTEAAAGFRVISCACSMEIRVPPNYEQQTIRCIRCAMIHQVSSAVPLVAAGATNAAAAAPAGFFPHIDCDCGHRVRVRPGGGMDVACDRCGARHSRSRARYGNQPRPKTFEAARPPGGQWGQVPCPECSASIEVSPQFAGTKVRCRMCDSTVNLV